jgi:hypothetical protein
VKPRRWEIEATGVGDDVEMIERPKGNYVLYEDYVRLKAEVERLTKLLGMCESIDNSIDRWIESKRNAAKEGKQSK